MKIDLFKENPQFIDEIGEAIHKVLDNDENEMMISLSLVLALECDSHNTEQTECLC